MKEENNRGGTGFISMLTILFIALKLIGIIDWSWWLVLLPMIIAVGIAVVMFVIYMIKG